MGKNKSNVYHIPVRIKPKYWILFIIGIIYFNIVTIAADYFLLFFENLIRQMNIAENWLMLGPLFLLNIYVLYLDLDYINSSIFDKQYVEINFEGITIKRLFKEIQIKWSEIVVVEKYSFRAVDSIRISRKKDLKINKYLRTFGTWFGFFYVDIKKNKYKDIDIRMFIDTVEGHLKKYSYYKYNEQ